MNRPHRFQDIINIKHKKPYLTWTAAAREAGFEVGNFTASGRYTKDGKPIPQVRSGDRAGQSARRRLEMKLDKELIDEVERQEKLGNLNGNDYFADRQRRLNEYNAELKRLRDLGFKIDDGHLTIRKNSSPDARAPENKYINEAVKQHKQPLPEQDMLDAFLPRSDIDDLYNFMAPSQMPKVNLKERTRMLSGQISGQQASAIADRRHQISAQSNQGVLSIQDAIGSSIQRGVKKAARNAIPVAGTVMDIQDTKQSFDEFRENPNLMNAAQLATQSISTGANVVSDAALATGIGAPVALVAEKVGGVMNLADSLLQGTEDYLKGRTTGP